MKLNSIKYTDTEQEWGFEEITFFDLTLLVGVSGVGKTQILRSIYNLKQIADGTSANGVKWEVNFQTLSGNKYFWEGEFENIKSKNEFIPDFFDEESDKNKPKIISERILINGKEMVIRNNNVFSFNGKEMPKLISTESAINILKEEDLIKEIYESFKLIIFCVLMKFCVV